MKLTHYIYICTAFAALAACSDDIDRVYTVGEADNAIVLTAGVGEGRQALTRADGDTPNLHVPFSGKTQLRLYVEGTWAGKASPTITQYTNCSTENADDKLDGASTDDKDIHPLSSFVPKKLYWDDYGTADPGNIENRANGLAVFGVAVEGLSTLPDDLKSIETDSWTSLDWSVKTDGEDVLKKDLIVSNNHGNNSSSTTTGIKFDKRNETTDKRENLLIFEHMMSKITFVLNAGDGFANGVFSSAPEVVLTRNKYLSATDETDIAEYCYVSGKVNIKTADTDITGTNAQTGKVTLGVYDATSLGKVTEHALVFPGSDFGNDDDIIARINADGNIYYITAKKIRAAILATGATDAKTKKGTNYIITAVINKTDIAVTATVKEWVDIITTETEIPVIDVDANIGDASHSADIASDFSFSFYRSTSYDNGYSTTSADLLVDGTYYKEEAYVSRSGDNWVMTNPLYWPNHFTHFQFRGVYPRTATSGTGAPMVILSNGKQIININNAAYSASTFPSNLMIARPNVATDETCDNKEAGHGKNLYSDGICATEGTVNLHFQNIMSQVEVRLKTSDGDDRVDLANATVEIVGGYTSGYAKLGDLGVVTNGSTGSYMLNTLGDDAEGLDANGERDGVKKENIRHSSIVPQPLTYDADAPLSEDNLRFKITIQSTDPEGTPDIYYADIQPIKVKVKGSTATPAPVDKWESGNHYIYTLTILKTKITIKATIADWITLEADEPVWL